MSEQSMGYGEQQWTPRRAQLVATLLFERTAAQGEYCVFLGNALVAEAKSLWPRRAAYRWWSKTNVRRRYTVVAYHHPAQLCWEWFLSVEFGPKGGWRSLRRWFGWFRQGNRLTHAWFRIPGLIEFSFHRQYSGWMLSHAGKSRLHALVDRHSVSYEEMAAAA